MKAIKAIGRWFGSMFVLCDWHGDGTSRLVLPQERPVCLPKTMPRGRTRVQHEPRRVPVIVLAQQYDEATLRKIVLLKLYGHDWLKHIAFRRWCATTATGLVSWATNPQDALRDVIRSHAEISGGMQPECVVHVVWSDGSWIDHGVSFAGGNWFESFHDWVQAAQSSRSSR